MDCADDWTDRTRNAYDAVGPDYATLFRNELDDKPLDRALLAMIVERMAAGRIIADVGCGPGHVAAWLHSRGARAMGVDLSPRMVELARSAYGDVDYAVGDMRALPVADAEWGAAVALYSLIHLQPDGLARALDELWRALAPGGLLLVAFHIGTEVVHRDEWLGHDVSVDFRFLEIDEIEAALEAAGFVLEARIERANYPEEHPTRRAYVLARKPD